MDERIKALWVEDLRNNADKQGKLVLRTPDDKYCCLGRLCEIYQQETGDGVWEFNGKNYEFVTGKWRDDVALPEAVADWAKVDPYKDVVDSRNIPQLNDETDIGFLGIATVIEENL